MRLKASEPDFSFATVRLGAAIHEQLVLASRSARDRWSHIFDEYGGAIPNLRAWITSSKHTVSLPLVSSFMLEWARNMDWKLSASQCCDAISIAVPEHLTAELRRLGGVENFSFMLGDMATPCSASLGNNDHNLDFGLIVNCPAWIELASFAEHIASFEKQLGMVVHHEMAHFRHQQGEDRAELHAHCRGVAWVLAAADSMKMREDSMKLLQREHPEVLENEEISRLLLNGDQATWRLLRLWIHHFRNLA